MGCCPVAAEGRELCAYLTQLGGPGEGIFIAKDPETCLKVLIELFCLSIGLQMGAKRKTDGYPQELTEFPPKCSSELGTLVQDNIMEQTMQMEDLL